MAIHITSKTKSLRPKPTSKEELIDIVKEVIDKQGPDADLNFIDTSLITDMSMLFFYINIENIKIDQWDTSNVTNMLSMFMGSINFKCDLSGWDVSNVKRYGHIFDGCPKMTQELQPKFK